MGTVVNLVASVGIAGSLTLGAMATWNGGSALTAAKDKIVAEADALGVYHTNEGKLLNKISALNSQISTLQSSGTADQTTITNLQNQVNDLTNQLNQAGTNENTLAQRVDDLTAQINQANTDASNLQTTVDSTTYVASDQTAVDNATAGTSSTTTTTTTPPPTDTTTTTTTTVATMPAGDTEVDYASITQPHVLIYNGSSPEVQMNVENGNVEITNVSQVHNYSYSQDGGQTWTAMNTTSYNVLGTTTAINNVEVQVKSDTGAVTKFWMVNK